MIRREAEYQEASKRLAEERVRLVARGLGPSPDYFITSRIAQGISRRDLPRRLDVHESQVSRDKRNEYFGITLERVAKILNSLSSGCKVSIRGSNAQSSNHLRIQL
jgi:hypothetical protein